MRVPRELLTPPLAFENNKVTNLHKNELTSIRLAKGERCCFNRFVQRTYVNLLLVCKKGKNTSTRNIDYLVGMLRIHTYFKVFASCILYLASPRMESANILGTPREDPQAYSTVPQYVIPRSKININQKHEQRSCTVNSTKKDNSHQTFAAKYSVRQNGRKMPGNNQIS